jgi:hypothetical protein
VAYLLVLIFHVCTVSGNTNGCLPCQGTVKKEIPAVTKQVRFNAGLRYNERHELVRTGNSGQPEYVGDPTPELDAAWDELMGGSSCLARLGRGTMLIFHLQL